MDERNIPQISKHKFYILLLIFILSGSLNIILLKNIQESKVTDKGKETTFARHIWLTSVIMFLGEFSSMFIYLFNKHRSKKNKNNSENNQETPLNKNKQPRRPPIPSNFIFGITSMMDLIGSSITNLSLAYLTASMNQMLKSTEFLFVCIVGFKFLGHKIYRHRVLGLVILIIGLFLIGLSEILKDQGDKETKSVLGIILLIPGLLLFAGQVVVQEILLRKFEVTPYQLIGFEGLFGLLCSTILVIILSFVTCKGYLKENVCFDDKFEDPISAFKQIRENTTIPVLILFFIIAIAVYNISGALIIEAKGVITRGVTDTVRSLIIWLFFLFIHPIKETEEKFHWLQLFGFILIIVANIIYVEILEIPFFELNKYTRRNLEKMENEKKKSSTLDDSIEEEEKIVSDRESKV